MQQVTFRTGDKVIYDSSGTFDIDGTEGVIIGDIVTNERINVQITKTVPSFYFPYKIGEVKNFQTRNLKLIPKDYDPSQQPYDDGDI